MPFQGRGSCMFHWRRWAWLTIWDKIKSHGTLIDWCTGREWPVNCMTVISPRWQSNMPFQGQRKRHIPMASYGEILSGRLNYYITRWRQEVSEFGDPLVTRCGRKSPHPAEWAPVPPFEQPWRTRKTQCWWPYEWGSIYWSSVRPPPGFLYHILSATSLDPNSLTSYLHRVI